jgi:hypothetical protein
VCCEAIGWSNSVRSHLERYQDERCRGGAKAYFAAELKSKDELVVKVSEVLAEQPF